MVKPHGRLVRVSFTSCNASTPRLSTWSSPTGLQGIAPGKSHLEEGFPLICFQRLSFRTSLPGRAAGATTGAQEVRPSGPLVLRTDPHKSPAPTRDRSE